MMISREIINRIIDASDIVDIIGEYLSLKKTGNNFKALCPFHEEDTPSFVVSPEKQIFHCFGCHKGGDVIKFVMEMEHIDFTDAIQLLAKRFGIELQDKHFRANNKLTSKKEKFYNINKRVKDFYKKCLSTHKQASSARNYLKSRSFNEDIWEKFELGFAPLNDDIVHRATENRLDIKLFEDLGLVRLDSYGKYKDWFKNRVMFPIFDARGQVVGFGARVLGKELPKYLNSKETVLFNKSSILYGLNYSLPYIKEKGYVIVLEGYADFISLYSNGIKNVVATLGTALTQKHVSILKRYVRDVTTVFDGDAAGVKASIRTVNVFLNTGLNLRVVTLPEKLDPEEYLKKYGHDALIKLFENSKNSFDYVLDNILANKDLNELSIKKEVSNQVFEFLSHVENRLEINYIIKQLAERIKEKEEDLVFEFKKYLGKKKKHTLPKKDVTIVKKNINKLETDFLSCVIFFNEYLEKAKKQVVLEWFFDVNIKKFLSFLFANSVNFKKETPSKILGYLRNEFDDFKEFMSYVTETGIANSLDIKDKLYNDLTKKIETRYLQAKLKDLKSDIDNIKDYELTKEKIKEYKEIVKKLK